MEQSRQLDDHPSGLGVFRIGTRGSPLALWQARTVRDRLRGAHGMPQDAVEIVDVKTTGDKIVDRRLAEIGGKGLFTKELEVALADGHVDCAVHSLKDVPTFPPDGLELAAFLEREDPRDSLVARHGACLDDLPAGAVVGTASLRREAMVRGLRPDLDIVLLRGNVGTRLQKVTDGAIDAAILATAGLKRLGLADRISQILETEIFVPAVGQGIVAVQVRANDERARRLVSAINNRDSERAARTERAFLARLDGSCTSPIGGHARVFDNRIAFAGRLMTADGAESASATTEGTADNPEALGKDAAEAILSKAGPKLLAVLED